DDVRPGRVRFRRTAHHQREHRGVEGEQPDAENKKESDAASHCVFGAASRTARVVDGPRDESSPGEAVGDPECPRMFMQRPRAHMAAHGPNERITGAAPTATSQLQLSAMPAAT